MLTIINDGARQSGSLPEHGLDGHELLTDVGNDTGSLLLKVAIDGLQNILFFPAKGRSEELREMHLPGILLDEAQFLKDLMQIVPLPEEIAPPLL